MNEIQQWKLVKNSTLYKLIIPKNIEQKIQYICSKIWDKEWSGILFYTHTGSFIDNSIELTCVDILLLDIGEAAFTEFTMSPTTINYMANNPELLDTEIGLIHSHNNMGVFFSSTDTDTLLQEGKERNHFLSLIVNNKGEYKAAITKKLKSQTITKELNFKSFNNESCSQVINYAEEESTIDWHDLQISTETVQNDTLVDEQIKAILETKKHAVTTTYSWVNRDPSLFDTPHRFISKDYEDTSIEDYTINSYNKSNTNIEDDDTIDEDTYKNAKIDKTILSDMIKKILNSSIISTKTPSETLSKLSINMVKDLDTVFKDDMDYFKEWASSFTELLCYHTNDSALLEEYDEQCVASIYAYRLKELLKQFPTNIYLEEYKNRLEDMIL